MNLDQCSNEALEKYQWPILMIMGLNGSFLPVADSAADCRLPIQLPIQIVIEKVCLHDSS